MVIDNINYYYNKNIVLKEKGTDKEYRGIVDFVEDRQDNDGVACLSITKYGTWWNEDDIEAIEIIEE